MKKILAVIDMQNDFTTGCLGNAECAAAIPEVVRVITEGDYDQVILTRDTHQDNYLQTQEGQKLPVEHCFENTPGWEVVAEVQEAVKNKFDKKDVKYFDKPSFGSTSLGQYFIELSSREEIAIDFVGVCTGICVISNAILAKAFCPEVKVSVIEKACACVTPQTHQTAIEAMKTCQIDILN